jgi:uncharacterized membrane protein YebE (DUF533 family)
MKVERPNARELTPEENKELERLQRIIESAIADGVISKSEYENIRTSALEKNPSPELLYQALELYRQLVTEKVKAGVLIAENFE